MNRHSTLCLFVAVLFLCLLPPAFGQRVFNNSRAGNPFSGRTTGTFSISSGSRWRAPSARGYQSPGNTSSSPPWTLRPTYNTSRSAASRYDASLNGRGRSSYSVRVPSTYSYSPPRSRSYSTYRGPVQYRSGLGHYHVQTYGNPGLINNFYAPGYPTGFGYPGYTGILAPPIVVPILGNTSGFLPPSMPFQQQVLPPSPVTSNMIAPQPVLPPEQNGEVLSQKIPVDETPVVNEFGRAAIVTETDVSAADRIRSLRYQTSGDSAFRKQDFASAEVFYKTAGKTAPVRRAPWLRLAWSQVAQQRYSNAVESLKKALALKDDPTNSWIDGEDLYGRQSAVLSSTHNDRLWEWLQQRPNSTDRLLLAASFQQLRGYSGIANELLLTATSTGLDKSLVDAFREVADDQLQQDIDAAAKPLTNAIPVFEEGGIRIKGTEVQAPPEVGLPEPASKQELPDDSQPPTKKLDLQPIAEPIVPDVLSIPK